MALLKSLVLLVLGFIALSIGLKLVFAALGIAITLVVLSVKLAIVGAIAYGVYSLFKAVTAS